MYNLNIYSSERSFAVTIERVLNNNAALVRENGAELVVLGKGVAFGANTGDEVDAARVEKKFKFEDAALTRFQQTVADIPSEHFALAYRAINYAQETLGKKLNDSIYITLPDHISTALVRYRENIPLTNPFKWDVKRFYPEEYKVGVHINNMVKDEFDVLFLDDEAAFMALHLVNAETGESAELSIAYDITTIIQEVCAFVKDYYGKSFDEDSTAYYRFITHTKFLAQRLCLDQHFAEEENSIILNMVERQHPKAYACAIGVKEMLGEKHGYSIDKNEIIYMAVHIASIAAA
ncbi:MAG: PRD domain-containing protein [Clostridia bacterium]|jgi:beta-glucoside operon transcriptional antiterminator|nr:PRD domain-containing protein [Clostridia bacterium]